MDKYLLKDIDAYILVEYQNLKLEDINNDNNKIKNLIFLIRSVNKKFDSNFEDIIKKHIDESNNALELLSKIKKEIIE